MAKLKLKKFPKKPKASASVTTKENWLKRVAEIRKENARIRSDKKKSEALDKKIRETRNYV